MSELAKHSDCVDLPVGEDDPWQVGTWIWVKCKEEDKGDPDSYETYNAIWTVASSGSWLGCITHRGTNYVRVQSVEMDKRNYDERIHLDHIRDRCWVEPDPQSVIEKKIDFHKSNVRGFMQEIRDITARLGVEPKRPGIAQDASSTAAGALSTRRENIEDYKKALKKAETEELPQLFQKVKFQHTCLAGWMKADALPLKAAIGGMNDSLTAVKSRILAVELYAGLCEECLQVKKGSQAGIDEPLHVMQRRHYMDEECIAGYTTGGIDIKGLSQFDRWLSLRENFERLLPHPKCMVAFKVRRYDKLRIAITLFDFFHNAHLKEQDKRTFLYIRNGDQLWRLETGIDFGERLFPDREDFDFREKYWVADRSFKSDSMKLVPDREYQVIMQEWRTKKAEHNKMYAAYKKWRKKHPNAKYDKHPAEFQDFYFGRNTPDKPQFIPFDHSSVYYDDVTNTVQQWMTDYHRIALVIQGLFDRSMCLHPHHPVRTWEQESFMQWVRPVYDKDRTLHYGEPPDWDAYRAACNAQFRAGSISIGQHWAWRCAEAHKEQRRRDNNWRYRNHGEVSPEWYEPQGDPGPGTIAEVARGYPKKKAAGFAWTKPRKPARWFDDVDENDRVRKTITVPAAELFNISAYQPGDFKKFYADPRTRSKYIRWAEFLLYAEEYHAGNVEVQKAE